MRNVSLGYLYIENFKSFIGPHEIFLSEEPGLKYVTGTNEVEPRLGSNGAGKTTLFDAIVWCWTGYSIRGHRAADLASWGTQSPRVITGFTVDGVPHSIDRTGVPNRLLLDDVPAEQEEITAFLLSRKRLLHSVIFGQSVEFFYDLSVPERGVLLDEVLNLDLWLKLAEAAGTKSTEIGKVLVQRSKDLSYNNGLRDSLNTEHTSLTTSSQTWETRWRAEIETELQYIERLEEAMKADQQQLAALQQESLPDTDLLYKEAQADVAFANEVRVDTALAQDRDAQLMAQLMFFQQHTTCPQCQQQIAPEIRQIKIGELERSVRELERYRLELAQAENNAIEARKVSMHVYQEAIERSARVSRETALLNQRLLQQQQDITMRSTAITERIDNPNNPFIARLAEVHTNLTKVQTEVARIEADYKDLEGEQIKYDYWRTGFRRVRLYQVKQITARLQLETANAANALGIGDWQIIFSTEVETKSGTMKPGVQITVKEPSGRAIVEESGGEEQRVRLACSMGFSALVQEMAGIHFDFECWDEPSAWLSAEGVDDLLDQLKERADSTGRSVWLLDHRTLTYPDFTEVWNVRKTKAGSSIALQQAFSDGVY